MSHGCSFSSSCSGGSVSVSSCSVGAVGVSTPSFASFDTNSKHTNTTTKVDDFWQSTLQNNVDNLINERKLDVSLKITCPRW